MISPAPRPHISITRFKLKMLKMFHLKPNVGLKTLTIKIHAKLLKTIKTEV